MQERTLLPSTLYSLFAIPVLASRYRIGRGRPVTADWRYPDPEKLAGEDWTRRKALSEILAGMERQFGAFMQLPFELLDEMSLRAQLDKLHQTQP